MTARAPQWLIARVAQLCQRLGVGFDAIAGQGRDPGTVTARRVIVCVLRRWPGPDGRVASFPELAYAMGRTSHSTLLHLHKSGKTDPAIVTMVETFLAELGLDRPMRRLEPQPRRAVIPADARVLVDEFLAALEESELYGKLNALGRSRARMLRGMLEAEAKQKGAA